MIVFRLIFLFLFIFSNTFLFSVVNFGSRDSAIKFSANTKFVNASPDLALKIDGTLVKDTQADFSGNSITFENGIFESNNTQEKLTAVYVPNAGLDDTIWLIGGSSFSGEPGSVLQKLYVQGTDNLLEGQALFNDSITYTDAATTLYIAIQNKLNQNIELNSGKLFLKDDLKLADNVFLAGLGDIFLNGRKLSLGSVYTTPWVSDLFFYNAADMELTGRTDLSSTWTFYGDNRLNGNGYVLDLSNNGKIYVSPGSTLYLSDIDIRGLADLSGKGKLELGLGSEIRTYDTFIGLDGDYTTTHGTFYVEGSTTFVLKDNDWTFNGDRTVDGANLVVDGVSLWLDTLDQTDDPSPGQLQAPLPLFINHFWQPSNLEYDLANNLELINSGTVREVCDRSQIGGILVPALVNGPLTHDITLDRSLFIHPSQRIEVAGNITIDGQGAKLIFCNPDMSQFVVRAGYTVTLKNVVLEEISQKTLDLRYIKSFSSGGIPIITEGQIRIGENVSFSLSEDITFSQGQLTVESLNQADDETFIFTIRGEHGKKRLSLMPDPKIYNNFGFTHEIFVYEGNTQVVNTVSYLTKNLFNLTHNTLAFQDVNLIGLEHVTHADTDYYLGAIGLMGQADINVGNMEDISDAYNSAPIPGTNKIMRLTDMNFVVQSVDNNIYLLKDNPKFTGKLLFADEGENSLHFDFLLTENTLNSGNSDLWWQGSAPSIYFGTGFIGLTSLNGMARLFFNDSVVNIYNDLDAFIVFENSYLSGKHMIINGDHIWDLYDPSLNKKPFITEIDQLEGAADIDNIPIISATAAFASPTLYKDELLRVPSGLMRGPSNERITALHLKQRKDKAEFKKYLDVNNKENTRDIILPSGAITAYKDMVNIDLSDSFGNIILYRSTASNFSIDPDQDLNMTLSKNSLLNLREDAEVVLKENDVLNIVEKGCQINIPKKLTIDGHLQFAANGQLTFNFTDDDAVLEINRDLDLEPNTELIFSGIGTVKFANGKVINLKNKNEIVPSLIFTSGAILRSDEGNKLTIKGVGRLRVVDGAQLNLDGSKLVVGDSLTDDIYIELSDTGMIKIINNGKMSVRKTSSSLEVDQSGILAISKNGLLEFNSLDSNVEGGNLYSFVLGPSAILSLGTDGYLSFASNSDSSTTSWISSDAIIYGGGNVRYLAKTPKAGYYAQTFTGQIQSGSSQVKFENSKISFVDIVKKLTNKVAGLSKAVAFDNSSGVYTLRMENGKQVAVFAGDVLKGESGTGKDFRVYGNDKSGSYIYYDYLGNRHIGLRLEEELV